MNNTYKILKSNFEHAESQYSDLRIEVINAIDQLNQYRNGHVTDDSLIKTLTGFLEVLLAKQNKNK